MAKPIDGILTGSEDENAFCAIGEGFVVCEETSHPSFDENQIAVLIMSVPETVCFVIPVTLCS